MCGFIVTTGKSDDVKLKAAMRATERRGPDLTVTFEKNGVTFVHHLLSITGAFTPQPFVDEQAGIVALFNGQIYNYLDFGQYNSDGEALIPLYKKYGATFTQKLDGEFALALFDFKKGEFLITTDVFGTKPLWFGRDGERIGLASYKSALTSLGFTNSEHVPPNTTRVYALKGGGPTSTKRVFDFSLEQNVQDLSGFFGTFEAAVQKRTRSLREKIFIGLSSGHDSGALALAMTRLNVHFEAYSILGEENRAVLDARHQLLTFPPHLIDLSYKDFLAAKLYLKRHAEPHAMSINETYANRDVRNDSGAIGLGHICSLAVKDGVKIYLSGQGSDEIISDYGMNGKKLASHSTFAGIFPEDLTEHFPWRNFYGGAQEDYLAKEEHVSGAYGIEGRYPFLDRDFVQAFLSLSPEIKNKGYKYPLAEYLRAHNYPFDESFKRGFVLGRYSLVEKISLGTLLELGTYGLSLPPYNTRTAKLTSGHS